MLSLAARGPVEAAQQVQQRRLPGPGRTDQGNELALADFQVDPVKCLYICAAKLKMAADLNQLYVFGHYFKDSAIASACSEVRLPAT